MLTTAQIENLIRDGESLKVEFKSDRRESLPDREIYETIVCLANTEGGTLLIGVENDGSISGARPRHDTTTDPNRLQAAIFNNTEPPINTRISVHDLDGYTVIAVEVDSYPEVCATKDGKSLRRVQGLQGPECQPFYPHQHQSRRSDLGSFDYSAQLVESARWTDLNPLEFERVRQVIERRRGDQVLLTLDDQELAKALRLIESRGQEVIPNIAGLLLVGREAALRRFIPTHEVAFQILDSRQNVLMNDWFYDPLLKTIEAVEDRFKARNLEQEVQVGMIRMPVPDYSFEAFREAVNNALIHRDYSRRGTVFIQFQDDLLSVVNPGGFLEGITLDNLLVHEPKHRNQRLAEAFRRIGVVETTGRGIDKIYLGQLWYGRPLPDYSQSDSDGVRLVLRGGEASMQFAAFVYEEAKAGKQLNLDELLILNHLQHERRVDVATVGTLTQKGEAQARSVLERLVENSLIEARGEKRGRVYHIGASLYRRLGAPEGYVHTHGFDSIRQEAMVLEYIVAHGSITRSAAAKLCSLSDRQAAYLLRRLTKQGKLRKIGEKRGTAYLINN